MSPSTSSEINLTEEHNKERRKKEQRMQWRSKVDILIDTEFPSINKGDTEYTDSTETKKKQRKILSNLPPNFDEHLVGHIKAFFIEQQKYLNFNPEEVDINKLISGELFEALVVIEDNIYGFDTKKECREQTPEQIEISEKILTVMSNPERFGLNTFSKFNPDLVKLYFENDKLNVEISIEVKKHFDKRTLVQIKEFQKKLREVCNYINNLDDAEKYGLTGLGKKGKNLGVSSNYKQIIVVPRNTDIVYKPDNTFYDRKMTAEEKGELSEIISGRNNTTCKRASFSHREMDKIAQVFSDKVRAQLTSQ